MKSDMLYKNLHAFHQLAHTIPTNVAFSTQRILEMWLPYVYLSITKYQAQNGMLE